MIVVHAVEDRLGSLCRHLHTSLVPGAYMQRGFVRAGTRVYNPNCGVAMENQQTTNTKQGCFQKSVPELRLSGNSRERSLDFCETKRDGSL